MIVLKMSSIYFSLHFYIVPCLYYLLFQNILYYKLCLHILLIKIFAIKISYLQIALALKDVKFCCNSVE